MVVDPDMEDARMSDLTAQPVACMAFFGRSESMTFVSSL